MGKIAMMKSLLQEEQPDTYAGDDYQPVGAADLPPPEEPDSEEEQEEVLTIVPLFSPFVSKKESGKNNETHSNFECHS